MAAKASKSSDTHATHIRNLFNKQQNHDPDRLLGYDLTTFTQIAKNLDGIQPGFYVIGGYTSMGKTTLMVNLLADALQSGIPCIYVSLDDNRDFILNRLVSIMTGIPFNRVKKKLDDEEFDEAKKAWDKLAGLAESGRFKLCDISHVDNMRDVEAMIKSEGDIMPVVFIDDVHNIPMGNYVSGDNRGMYIETANAIKKLVDTRKIAVIGTTELRKRSPLDLQGKENKVRVEPHTDDIMETGKFAYNANVIWFVYPEQPEEYGKRPDEYPTAHMVLKYAKNKLSGWTGKQKLILDRTCGKLREEKFGDSITLADQMIPEEGLKTLQSKQRRKKTS